MLPSFFDNDFIVISVSFNKILNFRGVMWMTQKYNLDPFFEKNKEFTTKQFADFTGESRSSVAEFFKIKIMILI